jgi:hypothetical protein
LFRSLIKTKLFRQILFIIIAFIGIIWIINISFDILWDDTSSIPLINLDNVYSPPMGYDKSEKINIKLVEQSKISIEGNKKFKFLNSTKLYDYYDTVEFNYPFNETELTNKFYFNFENSANTDSIFLVVSKSDRKDFYWKQIFFSSVSVMNLNSFSDNPDKFRLDPNKLIRNDILNDNDFLILEVYKYFNSHLDSIGFAECGTNCTNFKAVCDKFNLPCRLVNLQGGDANKTGFDNQLGYPLHVICEIYSTKYNKWFVVDPTYGFIYTKDKTPLNTVEISNKIFFKREKDIVQDSVLFTKRDLVGRDYFKYYENLFFSTNYQPNIVIAKFERMFFGKFNPILYQYSNSLNVLKNGYYYVGVKSIVYLMIMIISVNIVVFLISKRLYYIKQLNRKNLIDY